MPAAKSSPEPADPTPLPVDEESTDGAADETPLNRAERRAKGKKTTQVQPPVRGKAVRGTGPAAGPRLWANRRSG